MPKFSIILWNITVFSILFWNFMIINNISRYYLFTPDGGPEI